MASKQSAIEELASFLDKLKESVGIDPAHEFVITNQESSNTIVTKVAEYRWKIYVDETKLMDGKYYNHIFASFLSEVLVDDLSLMKQSDELSVFKNRQKTKLYSVIKNLIELSQ